MQDESSLNRTLQQVLSIFAYPEVQRRRDAGLITGDFQLAAVQVILPGDGSDAQVRLNKEVRIAITLKPDVVLPASAEATITTADIERLSLSHEDDANCGHFTVVFAGPEGFISFDARRNKAIATDLVRVSGEFLKTARRAKEEVGSWSACIDNLYSAMELAVKAFLWTMPWGLAFKPKMHHHEITRALQDFPTSVNGMDSICSTFEYLYHQRKVGRYLHNAIVPDWPKADSCIADTEAMLKRATDQIEPGRRAPLVLPVHTPL